MNAVVNRIVAVVHICLMVLVFAGCASSDNVATTGGATSTAVADEASPAGEAEVFEAGALARTCIPEGSECEPGDLCCRGTCDEAGLCLKK